MSTTRDSNLTQSIPAQWQIYPSIPTECPRRRDTFIAFAITNLVTMVLGLAVGCRPFIYIISCRMFGKKKRKNVYWYNWLPTWGLTFVGNVLCAVLIMRTPGYEHIRVADVAMLYLQRPRITLLALTTVTYAIVWKGEMPWIRAWVATAGAELLLQIMAAIWVVRAGEGYLNQRHILAIAIWEWVNAGLTAIMAIYIVRCWRNQVAHAEAVDEAAKYPNGFVMQNDFWVQNGFSERQAVPKVKRLTFRVWLILMVIGGLGYAGVGAHQNLGLK
ncbi:uncharacterized protein CTHT_0061380 [Thermochaetoides thermophila DSM 1495]|uniref:Uncharacterized protein n=1 Tax=Chaetomium thermophilum (strain DSM 1495 / CBS 144.50 / IMI 039719) TaxID=759272 RepID=G0SFA7_CHATD|nr:hypothetical protein CTHT_0061380 [Thermochaetoides thermophila DSM 1495]EGS18123.1 hypothetical protein CTHT_0061380 [Thermochaetoides thermophila DSM 1495]